MNLFGYEKSVFNSDKLLYFTHLKSSSYKEGTKTLESTWINFVESKQLGF